MGKFIHRSALAARCLLLAAVSAQTGEPPWRSTLYAENRVPGCAAGPGATDCDPHDSDYVEPFGVITLSELLRGIQRFNRPDYGPSPGQSEDGFCVGTD